MAIGKLRQASLAAEEEEEAATSLVTREIVKRKVKEAAVKKALELAAQISVPSNVLLQKTIGEAAQAAIALSEDLQQLSDQRFQLYKLLLQEVILISHILL